MSAPAPSTWFLTGVTGFLGKVVLEQLMRRREELGVARVLVLVRPRRGLSASRRFEDEVERSPCLSLLPPGWRALVDVVEGDLGVASLGLSVRDRAALGTVTHVVHCAASVSFDLPVQEAAQANIYATLHLLQLAKQLPRLARFVYVSTAYVTPHPGASPIREALVPLPVPATQLLAHIDAGATDASLLSITGHPNTYTFTKCVAEHLVAEQCGTLSVSIVRPSIISASRAAPFPGWIDSNAGFGAFVALIGLGHLRAVVGDPEARLDLIPVDDVTDQVVHAALRDRAPLAIRHAVAGLSGAARVGDCWEIIERWFAAHPTDRRPARGYLGRSPLRFRLADWWHHRVPLTLGTLLAPARRRKARKLVARLSHLNTVFPYFTTRSFDFRASHPIAAGRTGSAYVRTICRGVYRHLLRRDEREWVLAGQAHVGHEGDLRWALDQPRGNLWVRAASWVVTKVLRRITERVTVDLLSFERVRGQLPSDAAIVLVPSHRSYLDFILCSYLAFARPDLGLPIPHIAATMEFGRIPILGRVLQALHAFYLRRGRGAEDPELTQRVHALISRGAALEFFVEGARSRTREFLPPKRGLLRCLQATGRRVALIPIAISYDRLPEEAAIAVELAGQPKPPMRLRALLGWLVRAMRGQVALGRMHIAAGCVIALDPGCDVRATADAIIAELRGAMAVTEYQIRAYLAQHPIAGHDVASVERALVARGCRVLSSPLPIDPTMDPRIAATFGEHFRWALESGGRNVPVALDRAG
jgi:alcohol-forming fatty acyl-CoA reductase